MGGDALIVITRILGTYIHGLLGSWLLELTLSLSPSLPLFLIIGIGELGSHVFSLVSSVLGPCKPVAVP